VSVEKRLFGLAKLIIVDAFLRQFYIYRKKTPTLVIWLTVDFFHIKNSIYNWGKWSLMFASTSGQNGASLFI